MEVTAGPKDWLQNTFRRPRPDERVETLYHPALDNVQDWTVNVGSTTGGEDAAHIADWVQKKFPETPMRTGAGEGGWGGQREKSTALHVYATSRDQLHSILHEYGHDHPHEDSFAIMPHGHEGFLHPNPAYQPISEQ